MEKEELNYFENKYESNRIITKSNLEEKIEEKIIAIYQLLKNFEKKAIHINEHGEYRFSPTNKYLIVGRYHNYQINCMEIKMM